MEEQKEIVIKEYAFKQLEEEFNYYSDDYSINYAEKFRKEFFATIIKILPNYQRFPECRFLITKNKIYRNIFWKNYLIVLKIRKPTIEVLCLFHTKQNPSKLKKIRKR
jgi:hypothetical protein